MADLIELDLVVRDKGLKASISTVERLERQIIKAAKAVDQNSISQVRYNKILLSTKREYEALGLSSQKATSTVRKFAAAQSKATAETAKENSALKKLKSSYDSVYAAEQKRLRLKKLLRAEVAAGNMTLREAGRELLLYRQRLHETSQGFQFAKNRANKFGMVAQQVGYQVGDFFVQVQSGASALVAFGQQGTQLAGLLPGIYGAIVGIGLSLGTMLIKGFMDASGASQTLSEALDELGSSSSAVMASFDRLNDDKLNETFGDLTPTIKKLEDRFLALNSAAELRNLINVLDKVKESSEISFGSRMLEAFKRFGTREDIAPEMFTKKYGFSVGKKVFDDLVDGMIAQAKSGNVKGVVKAFEDLVSQATIVPKDVTLEGIALLNETKMAAVGVAESYAAIGGSAEAAVVANDKMTSNMDRYFDSLKKLWKSQDAAIKASKDNLDAQIELMMKQYDEQLKIDALRDKETLKLDQQLWLANSINDSNADAEVIAQAKAAIARQNQEILYKSMNFTADEVDLLMQSYDALQISLTTNKEITEEKKRQLKVSEKISANLVTMADAEYQMFLTYQAYGEGRVAGTKVKPPKAPKGKKPTTMEDPIKALERQIELSKALFGLQGAARREEEIYMQLKFKNQDADIKAGKEELELLAERVALEEQRTEAEQMNLKNISPLKKYVAEYAKLVKLKDSGLGDEAFAKEVAKLNEELAKSNPLLNSFTDAFADFLGRGARDFKSFAKDILNDFKSMLIQMITTAARNKIMFSMGMGGGALGTAAAAGGGGSFASQAGGSIIGSVAKSAFGSIIQGGFTGASSFGAGLSTSLGLGTSINGAVSMALSPTMASVGSAVGALAGPLLAVGALFSFLRSKTKELDSGLRVTVDNMDVLVKTFRTIQKSRFWGLSKRVRTTEEEASSEVSDPIVDAVATIQESVMEAASAFGVASDKFDDFTYDFEVSLKGLTEDQKLEKLNEEFTKLGDSFTEMSGLFSNMNDLMAVYQQRLDLENQLLVAQGEVVKLREQELETINVLNRELASRLHILQAKTDMQSALTAFASGISEQQGLIRRAVDALVKPLQEAIDRTRTQAEKSYNIFKAAADKSVDSAKNIVDIITSALDSRTIISESSELLRYQTAQKQLASFAGGASFDEASLRRATEGVSIDSQKFFGSFEDYARDFYRTQINLEDLADVAEKELSEVEQQIDIAQKAYEVAMGTYQEAQDFNVALNNLISDLAVYTEVSARNEPFIEQIKAEGDRQVQLLEQILEATLKAFNPDASESDLVGNIMSVANAMGILGVSESDLEGAVVPLNESELVGDIGSHIEDFNSSLTAAYDRLGLSLEDITKLNLATPFSEVDLSTPFSEVDLSTPFSEVDLSKGFSSEVNTTIGSEMGGSIADAIKEAKITGGLEGVIGALNSAIGDDTTGLGSIVSSLTSAISNLTDANTALAAAEQSKAIANVTATAARVNAEIANLESSIGTTATGATPEQESQLASLQAQLKEEQSKDGEDRNLGTGHYSILIKLLNQEIAAQVGPAEMSPEDSATLANLTADLEALRGQIRDLGGTPTFSSGGYHSGGMRLVGENGPELEATGPSRIYSAQQTRNMLSGGSGEVVVELRSLRREVSELKAEQRKVGVENVKYNKKSYDLYREWDTVGLPATRTA